MEFDKESFYKEIELIQSCITRMANNSFLLKGWLISLIVVAFALLPEEIDGKVVCYLIGAITLVFWYLDGFFLRMERLYTKKYNWVIVTRPTSDFKNIFDLDPYNKEMWLDEDAETTLQVMFSKTLVPFYGLVIIGLVIFIVLYNQLMN